jgi:hypothetical protein
VNKFIKSILKGFAVLVLMVPIPQTLADSSIPKRYDSFRVVTNQAFNIRRSLAWTHQVGELTAVHKKLHIFDVGGHQTKWIAVTNSPPATQGKRMDIIAMRVGTVTYIDVPIELWDCGHPYIPKAKRQ